MSGESMDPLDVQLANANRRANRLELALDEARAEVERLRKDPLPALAMLRDIERTVAEKQREACAVRLHRLLHQKQATAVWVGADEILATPLVTEGDK